MQYYFEGRFDLVRFVKTVQEAGLFLHLRIGPYACAEWNYGYLLVTVSLLHNFKKMSIYFLFISPIFSSLVADLVTT